MKTLSLKSFLRYTCNVNTNKRKVIVYIISVTLLLMLGISVGVVLVMVAGFAPRRTVIIEVTDSFRKHRHVAHALGGIDGRIHTNSLEAFNLAYANGFRVFEVDLRLIGEEHNYLVAMHSIETYNRFVGANYNCETEVTLENFLARKIYGKYTPLAWSDVAELMANHKDIFMIIDGKYTTKELVLRQYQILVDEVIALGFYDTSIEYNQILERIVPYLFNQQMFYWIESIHSFPEYIFAHYLMRPSFSSIVSFITNRRQITAVAMSYRRIHSTVFPNRLLDIGIVLYAHTITSHTVSNRMQRIGVHGMITPFFMP